MSSSKIIFRFPVVAKASSEALYLLLSSNGEKLLPADKCEALIAYLTSKDWLMIDVSKKSNLDNEARGLEEDL
jgi:hypothetical protein